MLILAFETSAKAASAALLEDGKLLAESYQNTGLTHSQTLMVMAENLLHQCGKTVNDVNAVAVAAGPGSFTGVRIGVAAAKGFAWGREVPCYGVSTLEAMALSLGAYQGYVCPVMDARRSQVYNALFYVNHGSLKRITEDRAIALAQLKQELAHLTEPVFLVGDGSVLTYKTLSGDIPTSLCLQNTGCISAPQASPFWPRKSKPLEKPATAPLCTPTYLRLSQAERERLEREQQNS